MERPMYSTEVHEGETEDIWAHEVYANSLLEEQERLEELLQLAYLRKETAETPVTRLLATVSISARTHRVESHAGLVESALQLPLPDHWNE